ncbi:hypothetical protein HYFRA_00004164 [Hymenoscyphus fraxineus]|uniref:RNA ligase/cyclic nucleotide phosphodiesterase n=1 Tax=Hymenoscyphus fraxineus TaxID=746836 RepID=A0A9N9PNM1_9HELO|nr:hypothetical protein HYFRA_00004164 [Hymenoscyphus fraxineus]
MAKLETADSRNNFEDLSGVDISAFENPYDALIEACHNHPAEIQARYATHRTTRNAQQREKLLAPDFSGLILDPILQRLEDPTIEPGYVDPRNCLVFWARPPTHIRSLVDRIQKELTGVAPNLWLMPIQNLHLTAFEVTHSLTAPQIDNIITHLGSQTYTKMVSYPSTHRTRLINPLLSFDGAAIALSFLPAAGEALPQITPSSPTKTTRIKQEDRYTYHHLRRDLFNLAKATGVSIDSRYVVPSSHITIARFLTQGDHDEKAKMEAWLGKIDEINEWLEREFWTRDGGERDIGKEWVVGTEKGLDFRKGTLWYGGGETVMMGEGF